MLGPQRTNALLFAADLWRTFFLSSFPGETVTIGASFDTPLGGAFPAPEAQGGPNYIQFLVPSPGVRTDVWYGYPLAEHLVGADLNPGALDGRVIFYEGATIPYYYGLDGKPGNMMDFVTTALHELGHVFGVDTQVARNGEFAVAKLFLSGETIFFPVQLPTVYDLFVIDEFGARLVDLEPAERVAAATSLDGLFWGGANGIAGNGGALPNLSAPFNPNTPDMILSGIAIAHLSRTFGPGPFLMTTGAGGPGNEVYRSLSPVETASSRTSAGTRWHAYPSRPRLFFSVSGSAPSRSPRAAAADREPHLAMRLALNRSFTSP